MTIRIKSRKREIENEDCADGLKDLQNHYWPQCALNVWGREMIYPSESP